MLKEELPPVPYAKGRIEHPSSLDNNLHILPINGPTTLPRPRAVPCLAPNINITPEVTTIEAGRNIFWVAIEISAPPRCAPEEKIQPGAR
jgi:hypothetical protein